jgi:TatD DNase family protein
MLPFINIHSHIPGNGDICIYSQPAGLFDADQAFCSFGLHPWDLLHVDIEPTMLSINQMCDQKRIMAVGECGIDRFIKTDIALQTTVFRKQVRISETYNLPLIVHCVKAWSDLAAIRKTEKAKMPWIYHGFTGNEYHAKHIAGSGSYLSFGKDLLSFQKVQEVFEKTPIGAIFLETDDANISIETIYIRASELLNVELGLLKETMLSNFQKVFGRMG